MPRALVNARIHTMQRPDTTATAICWDGDTIVAVGDEDEIRQVAAARGIEVEDAGGRVVLPGFVDAHMHFLHVGIKRTRPDLRGATSKHEALDRVRTWLEAHPGDDAVTGEGWDEAGWHDDRPTRQELDDVAGDRPLVLRRICGHVAVANTAALPAIQERWDDERVDADTGLLLEEPSLYLNEILPAPEDVMDLAVQEACRVAHHIGVTTVGDYEQAPLRGALLRAARDGTLTVRVQCSIYVQQLQDAIQEDFRTGRGVRAAHRDDDASHTMEAATARLEGASRRPTPTHRHETAPGLPDVAEDPASMLRDGGLKVFLDGSLGGHTALMLEPYDDRPDTHGRAIWDDEELDAILQDAHDHGIQVHAHAIGDGAIEQGLAAYERLATRRLGRPGETLGVPSPTGQGTLGHRFEHYEIVHDEQVERTADLGIWASSQPNFVGAWSAKGGMYEERIGDRFHNNNRFRSFTRAGLRVAFGSDGMPFGPLYGIQSAIEHPEPDQRLRPAEAVWHYTHEAAASLGRDDVGVLAPGKKADVLLLDIKHLDDRPAQEWVIQETVVDGRTMLRSDRPYVCDDDVATRAD